jgi:hypothetical protein
MANFRHDTSNAQFTSDLAIKVLGQFMLQGCLDTSSILRLWAGVILATLFVCILVVAGDKGCGPLKELNR